MNAFLEIGPELGGFMMGIRTHLSFMPLSDVGKNAFLTSIPFADDIHDEIFTMDVDSTSRPDGSSGRFYQRCWDVVGSDMVLAVQDFFITVVIFPGLNSSFTVFLPKLRDSISIDPFQPIVLSNFLLEISSKIWLII
ncbi:hypothetical protein Dsin_015723 [Dipteronia sinensis]|uniref:Uncharacterized protein n=1 Tax=Dipteronia sinensis TaxID=43782 RepID=A0AAE0ACZ4_9ROSI|nr:hypothetical protein Dsin_015723 [Dipteronia sinensis]